MVIEHRQAFLRNLNTSWLEGGKKKNPIILFLHGYPDGPEIWSEQIRHFSTQFHVICPYARGTFASEPGRLLSRFSPDSLCLDLLEILKIADPKGKQKIHVVGHDLGGAVAWRLATYLGPRLSRLVIINSLSIEQMATRFLQRPRQWFHSWYLYPFLIPKIPGKIISRFSKKLIPWAYQFGGLAPENFPKLNLNSPFPSATLRLYQAFAQEAVRSLRKPPKKILAPTLVLWGKQDPFLLPPTLDELESYAQSLTVRILEGSHWLFREQPVATNHLIETFFTQGEADATSSKKSI